MTFANESPMEKDSVTCSWVFTVDEYKTTQVLARRLYTPWGRLALFACIPLMGFAGMFTSNAKNDFHDPNFWIPIVILILIILYVISQQLPIRAFCGTWNFRRGDVYNAQLSQTISREGYSTEESDARSVVKWSGLERALETPAGFALFRPAKKKTFLWLPKHGFSSPKDIDLCRALIKEYLPDFRTLES